MRKFIGLSIITLVALVFVACSEEPNKEAIEQRAQVFDQAEALAPTPSPVNFPLRRALVKFTERQDELNHPWFVYILGDNGNVLGYYVAQTVPINACNFLSSTEQIVDRTDGDLVIAAPSLDGIYYGGSGASSGCDAWFFFDTATDALVQIRGVNWYAADQPLSVQAEAITIRQEG